jgi:hypothetical protein
VLRGKGEWSQERKTEEARAGKGKHRQAMVKKNKAVMKMLTQK